MQALCPEVDSLTSSSVALSTDIYNIPKFQQEQTRRLKTGRGHQEVRYLFLWPGGVPFPRPAGNPPFSVCL